ncbi:hypothetical protein N0V91_006227 [Didymella pomorum]|uniref:Mitochondrial carrier n=1 Tax=Didymella pomorum TaxID=749634 RepID=A0A9W8ZDS1_9PLEO|nr:hypothetical protein N0V91_006227 [Didymella pomorum]
MSGNTNSDILIAGAIAAFTVDLLVYPLDTLKTRFQSPDYARLYTNQATGKPNPALFRGMYQGIGSVIIATLPSSGAFFTTYERTKSALTSLNRTSSHPNGLLPTPVIHAAASSLAELVSCAILTPAEVIKQNAQMVSSSESGTNATVQTLRKFQSNPLALWRGYASLAGRNLPFTAMQFPMFEKLKQGIKEYRDENGLTRGTIVESGIITAISAGSAGAVAAVITTPVDVLKTRIMLSAAEGESSEASSKSAKSSTNAKNGLVDALGESVKKSRRGQKGTWQITQEIVKEQGYKGLWRGGALRAVWTFVGAGLYLGAYESGRVYLAARRGEQVDEADLM